MGKAAVMTRDMHREIHASLNQASPARLGFTRRAFQLLPSLESPTILDVGCGRGGPTLELARMTLGRVIGIDIDQSALVEITRRIEQEGVSERVRVLNSSAHDIEFQDETFDIIWAEAFIHIVGFEKGLDDWRRLLKRDGFLVVHDMAWLRPDPPDEILAHWRGYYPGIRTIREYVAEIPRHGYALRSHFALPDDFWWLDYYDPLERQISELRKKYNKDQEIIRQLTHEQEQVDLYKKYSRWFGSAFFIMQKHG